MPDTTVINVSGLSAAARSSLLETENFVYIGRGSRFWPSRGWGNKFSVSEHGREGAIAKHYAWLLDQVTTGAIAKADLAGLHGKVLGCHCAPEACHGDTLKRAAAWAHGELQQGAVDAAPTARRDFRYPPEFRAWLERKGLAENPRVLICGERSFGAADVISEIVNSLSPGTVVIEGEGGQADLGAAAFAVERELPVAGFPADWEVKRHTPTSRIVTTESGRTYDRLAGFLRNTRMVECAPERVIALADWTEPEGGTGSTVQLALKAGIPVTIVNSRGERRDLEASTT